MFFPLSVIVGYDGHLPPSSVICGRCEGQLLSKKLMAMPADTTFRWIENLFEEHAMLTHGKQPAMRK